MDESLRTELTSLILDVVEEKGFLGGEDVEEIARRLMLPSSRVYGFYSQFAEFHRPPGRIRIGVCLGPACAARDALGLLRTLREKLGRKADISLLPGILRPHLSPAISLEVPGEVTRLIEGITAEDAEGVARRILEGDHTAYPAMEGLRPLPILALPEHEPSPWCAGEENVSRPPFGGDLRREVARDRRGFVEIMEVAGMWSPEESTSGNGPLRVLICDTLGGEPESSVDLAVSLLNPEGVVAGSALAALALGAEKLYLYVPWSDAGVAAGIKEAAEKLLSGTEVEYSVFRGPAYIPCTRDMGKAAVVWGMMLWRAASLYRREGAWKAEPGVAVLPAARACILPWIFQERKRITGEYRRDLVSVAGMESRPRLVEIPQGVTWEEFSGGVGDLLPRGKGIKAVYMEGVTRKIMTCPHQDYMIPGGTEGMVLLGPSACMAEWALHQLLRAGEGCCGGCTPGKNAPTAAADILMSLLEKGGSPKDIDQLRSLINGALELALCPRLGETFTPVLTCLDDFRGEFVSHAVEGICEAGSCAPRVRGDDLRG